MKKFIYTLLVLITSLGLYSQDTTKILTDVVISTNRFSETPTTSTKVTLDSVTLMAQETPQVLSKLSPSVISQTDNGTPFGYSYLRVRGLSSEYGQNRVLYSMNGVPLNEGENSHLFTSNFTDLLSNTTSFDFIRGASISGSGSPSFIGAMEMVSKSPFGQRGGEFSTMYGSFNSYRASLAYTTGEISPGFGATIRVSATGTDGFRDNSYGHSQSVYTSLGYRKGKHIFKVVSFLGNTRNGQSFLAVPEGLPVKTNLLTDKQYGIGAPNQPDHFINTITQIQYSYSMGPKWTFNMSPYLLTNNGNYDLPSVWFGYDSIGSLTNTNLKMVSKTVGGYLNVKYDNSRMNFIIGTGGNYFHVNNLYRHLPNDTLYSNNTVKTDINIYTRFSYLLVKHFRFSTDLQSRAVSSDYIGSIKLQLYSHMFFNYSFGVSFPFQSVQTNFEPYVTFSQVSREPTKTNMFVNIPSGNVDNISQVTYLSPERNRDLEFGIKMKHKNFDIKVNGFYMNIRREILSSGTVNSVGAVIGYSVPKSQRVGIELESKYTYSVLNGGINFTYQNSQYTLINKTIKTPLLSPNEILYVYQGIDFKGFRAILSYQFVRRSLINNDPVISTNDINQLNLNLGYTYKSVSFDLLVYNLTNKNQTLGGYYDGNRNFFYSAGVTAYGAFKVKF